MPTRYQFILAAAVLAVVVATPLVYSSHQNIHLRNLRVVEEGVLYRSGQLSPAGMQRVVHEHGIKTVITLRAARASGQKSPDEWEEAFCAARGINHVRLAPRVWGADEEGEVPADVNVQQFVDVLRKQENHPVLVHCFAGIHRTGTMCAIYRMEFQGWTAERAMAEMQLYGFDPEDMHQHIEGYLLNYKPGAQRR